MISDQDLCSFHIPLTISTTKRVNTCLVPSSDSWIIQAKKKDPCTRFCSKRVCTVSCSGVPFGSHKSETHFVVIYFGMRCVVPETPKSSSASHARPARIIKRRNVGKNLALATGSFFSKPSNRAIKHAITNHNLNVSHSTRFLLVCPIVKFHPSSKNPCSDLHSP